MKTWIRLALFALVFVVLAIFIAKGVDVKRLVDLVLNFSKTDLLVFCGISLVVAILKSWRFLILLSASDIDISFTDAVRIFLAGQATSPLPGGEVVRGILIKEETGTKIVNTIGPLFAQAYLEILSAALLMLIGSLFFQVIRIPSMVVLVIFFLFTVILIKEKLLQKVADILNFKILKGFFKKLFITQKDFKEILYQDVHKTLLRTMLVSIVAHLAGGLLIYLIARSFHIDLSLIQSTFIYAAGIVIQGLAFTPGGIGFTEGGILGMFLLFNVATNEALGIVLIYRLATLIFYVLVGILVLLLFYGKDFVFKGKLVNG